MDNDIYVSFSGTPGGILKASTQETSQVVSLIIHNNTDKLTTASGIYAHSNGIVICDGKYIISGYGDA